MAPDGGVAAFAEEAQRQVVAEPAEPQDKAPAAERASSSAKEVTVSTDAKKAKTDVKKAKTSYNVVFVTSEAAPFSKTGGLGDVCGSLPPALSARGHRVMVVLPLYQKYPEAVDTGLRVDIMGAEVGFFHHKGRDVDWVFVDHPSFPRPGGLYGDKQGTYGDNQYRYMLLCLAALEAPLQLGLDGSTYGENCIFICNDWMAGLVPIYLAAKYRPHGVYKDARSVLAIHNLRHQGVFPPGTFDSLGIPGEWYGALEYQYPPHLRMGSYEEEGRSVNTLKAAITTSDRVVTVSPGYAWEICTPEGGWGMEQMLSDRSYVLNGVLNGIDLDEWNPATDPHIPTNYTEATVAAGKRACKEALQKELGLPVNGDIPMIGFIGRLDYQKGADLVLGAAPWIVQQNVQLVCLGTGDPALENGFRWLESEHRNAARGWVGFNVPMSHKITAAADLLLMPSRFEPCGLNQLYAMRYGTVPVAHATGGLRDTVLPFNPWEDEGTGWTFSPCSTEAFIYTLGQALETFRAHNDSFRALQLRGMRRDSSWDKAAQSYEQIFDWVTFDEPFCK